MAVVVGPQSFYAVRLLLGAAEAGFFPGVILYLTYWFPTEARGRIVAIFMVAIPISSFLGSPVSAALLGTDGWLGLHGWQWLFILEAVPAVALGFAALVWLPEGPRDARWLSPVEREVLATRLAQDGAVPRPTGGHLSLWRVMTNRYVLAASLIYAGASGASQCLSLWQPQIIKSFGLSLAATGWLNALPFGIASVLMILWGRNSDRRRERVWHTALPLALLAGSLVVAIFIGALLPTMVLLCLAVHRHLYRQGAVLGAVDRMAVGRGRGRRHRADQRHGQCRRLRRHIAARRHQGCYGLLRAGPHADRGPVRGGLHRGADAGTRSAGRPGGARGIGPSRLSVQAP